MKRVAKLGGMIGDCNLCSGKGEIREAERVKPVAITVEDVCSKELIHAVADCVPASSVEAELVTPDVKIDGKRALYKRKSASK
jgi:hypothetical protein